MRRVAVDPKDREGPAPCQSNPELAQRCLHPAFSPSLVFSLVSQAEASKSVALSLHPTYSQQASQGQEPTP